jgi:hypothetical protein
MITIENIKRLGDMIVYPMSTIIHETHYEFIIDYNIKTYNITLSRFTPPMDPTCGHYLMLCRSEMIWFTKDELKDIVKVSNGIYQMLNRVN